MSRGQFYLDKSNAKISGVCSGIAEYTGVDSLWIRLGAVLLLFAGFPIVIAIYFGVAWLADSKPMGLYSEEEEMRLLRRMERRRERRGLTTTSSSSSRLRSDLSDMDRRIADMEAHYSSSNSRLAAEIDSLR